MGSVAEGILGGGEQTSSDESTFTPFQSDEFQLLLDEATRLYESGGFLPDSLYGGINPIAERSPEQLAMIQQGLEGIQGISGQGMSAVSRALGPYDPNASGVGSVIDMVGRDINRNLSENVLPSIGFGAQGAGQFGGSRQGIAEGLAARSAQDEFSDVASSLRYDDYNAFQNRQQNILNNLGNISNNLVQPGLALSDIDRQDRQSQIDVELEEFAYQQGLDLQNLQILKSLISGNMGGTQTGTSTQEGGGGGLGGILGSFAGSAGGSELIAGMFGGGGAAAAGAGATSAGASGVGSLLAGAASFFSDSRLKENIEFVGKTNGHNVYKWDWNEEAKRIGASKQPNTGLLAQEYSDTDAVAKDEETGYYTIDYRKIMGA